MSSCPVFSNVDTRPVAQSHVATRLDLRVKSGVEAANARRIKMPEIVLSCSFDREGQVRRYAVLQKWHKAGVWLVCQKEERRDTQKTGCFYAFQRPFAVEDKLLEAAFSQVDHRHVTVSRALYRIASQEKKLGMNRKMQTRVKVSTMVKVRRARIEKRRGDM